MTQLIYVPPALMAAAGAKVELSARVIAPGMTASGVIPLVSTDGGGLWSMAFSTVAMDDDIARTWLAIASLCDGGVNKLIVPCFVGWPLAPWPIVGGSPLIAHDPVPHSDDALFSDGTGYVQRAIVMRTVGTAPLRATTLTLEIIAGSALRGGEHFEIVHQVKKHRIYRVTRVVIDGDGNSVVTIRPPLREVVPAGVEPNFDQPRCVMQPVSPDALDAEWEPAFLGHSSPRLIEAFV